MGRRRLPGAGDRPGSAGKAGAALTEYHRFLRVAGLKVRYEDFGQGPTILLLHGIGHFLRNWSRTVPALVEAGFRALSIDMPGFGYSEPTPNVLDEDETTSFWRRSSTPSSSFSNLEKIRVRLPDARYVIYAEAGHMLPYEVARRLSRDLIEFLK